jgi:predicted short-subunit dehydrogenase-like oxidoreductase (DUF2520 family)
MLSGTTGTRNARTGAKKVVTEPQPPPFPFSFVLVGAGRVGTAVSRLLVDAGHSFAGVASRRASSAERAAKFLAGPVFSPEVELPPSDVVLIGVTDPSIEDVSATLASHDVAGRVFWHLAGSLGLAPLKPALERGAIGCAIHPVQACPDVATAITRLPGSAWGVTSSPEAAAWARRTVEESLQGNPVQVAEENRPLWHTASVIVSNGIAALMASGESILEAIGVEEPQDVLGPLAAGTVLNAQSGGGGGATLTGPVVRGEVETVHRHLRALRAAYPDLAESYAQVARFILEQARRAGRVDPDTVVAIRNLLDRAS